MKNMFVALIFVCTGVQAFACSVEQAETAIKNTYMDDFIFKSYTKIQGGYEIVALMLDSPHHRTSYHIKASVYFDKTDGFDKTDCSNPTIILDEK
jgi:hypothetical protein